MLICVFMFSLFFTVIRRDLNGRTIFECSYCGHAATDYRNMKRHVLTHTGQKPHICRVCNRGFSRSAHLKRHLVTHLKKMRLRHSAGSDMGSPYPL